MDEELPWSRTEDQAWLLIPRRHVPQRWRERAVEVCLIPLNVDEVAPWHPVSVAFEELPTEALDLIRMTSRGFTSAAIGRHLGVSTRTVQRRQARIRARLGMRSNAELIAMAVREGL